MASVLGMAIGVAVAITAVAPAAGVTVAFAVAGGARVVSVFAARIVVVGFFLAAGAPTAGIARRSGRRCDRCRGARHAGAAAAARRDRSLVAADRGCGGRARFSVAPDGVRTGVGSVSGCTGCDRSMSEAVRDLVN